MHRAVTKGKKRSPRPADAILLTIVRMRHLRGGSTFSKIPDLNPLIRQRAFLIHSEGSVEGVGSAVGICNCHLYWTRGQSGHGCQKGLVVHKGD
jgi:hypothetical protein